MIRFRQILCIALVSFILHFLWESTHVVLYQGYEHLTKMPIELYATIGDVLYVLLGVLLVALIKRSFAWLESPHPAEYVALAIIGAFISIMVEYKGLYLGRWEYLSTMPLAPFFEIGLSPLVQMTILLPLSVWIGSRFVK